MKVLVVSPHPDDAEIGMGGFMQKLTYSGHQVVIAVCSTGSLNMVHSGKLVEWEERKNEQIQAAAILDVEVVFLELAEASKFDRKPQALFVSAFDKLFPEYDIVYLPTESYNEDHSVVWRAGFAAFRPGKMDGKSLYCYEQPIQAHGGFPVGGKQYVPLSPAMLSRKLDAVSKHKSQMGGREKTLFGASGIDALARMRGLECGKELAELVYLIKEVLID